MLEAALFPRRLASHFWFFDFCITFYVGSGSKSGSGTEACLHYGSGSAKEKNCVSGSYSTTML
jgi:hypothetical protein